MIFLFTVFGIALLILAHEFGHFVCAKAFGVRVDEFGIGFPPRLFSVTRGETRYSINLLPLGGFVRLHGETVRETEGASDSRSFIAQPAWRRLVIVVAGVCMNIVLGWLILSSVFYLGTPRGLLVNRVLPDSAAEASGMLVNDFITDFTDGAAFTNYIRHRAGKTFSLHVVRDGKMQTVSVTPRAKAGLPAEASAKAGVLGVVIAEAGTDPLPLLASLREGLLSTIAMMAAVLVGLWSIIAALFTQGRLLEGFVGPVGIFSVASHTGSLGLVYLLQLIGAISVNLAVLNVIPFPALDGGRVLFLLFEKIKGSRLTPKFEMTVNAVGFALLFTLIIAVTLRDVAGLF